MVFIQIDDTARECRRQNRIERARADIGGDLQMLLESQEEVQRRLKEMELRGLSSASESGSESDSNMSYASYSSSASSSSSSVASYPLKEEESAAPQRGGGAEGGAGPIGDKDFNFWGLGSRDDYVPTLPYGGSFSALELEKPDTEGFSWLGAGEHEYTVEDARVGALHFDTTLQLVQSLEGADNSLKDMIFAQAFHKEQSFFTSLCDQCRQQMQAEQGQDVPLDEGKLYSTVLQLCLPDGETRVGEERHRQALEEREQDADAEAAEEWGEDLDSMSESEDEVDIPVEGYAMGDLWDSWDGMPSQTQAEASSLIALEELLTEDAERGQSADVAEDMTEDSLVSSAPQGSLPMADLELGKATGKPQGRQGQGRNMAPVVMRDAGESKKVAAGEDEDERQGAQVQEYEKKEVPSPPTSQGYGMESSDVWKGQSRGKKEKKRRFKASVLSKKLSPPKPSWPLSSDIEDVQEKQEEVQAHVEGRLEATAPDFFVPLAPKPLSPMDHPLSRSQESSAVEAYSGAAVAAATESTSAASGPQPPPPPPPPLPQAIREDLLQLRQQQQQLQQQERKQSRELEILSGSVDSPTPPSTTLGDQLDLAADSTEKLRDVPRVSFANDAPSVYLREPFPPPMPSQKSHRAKSARRSKKHKSSKRIRASELRERLKKMQEEQELLIQQLQELDEGEEEDLLQSESKIPLLDEHPFTLRCPVERVIAHLGREREWGEDMCLDISKRMHENAVFRVADMLDCWDGMLTFERVGVVLAVRKFLEVNFPEDVRATDLVCPTGLLRLLEEYSEDVVIPFSALELDRVLGAGGQGEVRAGKLLQKEDTSGPVDVAVKTLKDFSSTREAKEALVEEASLMRSLQHDSVVRIFGVCLDPTSIVMELMEESLHSRIRRFPGAAYFLDRLHWGIAAAKALEFLHTRDPIIVHGDIKSMNFLASRDPSREHGTIIKLSDFGLSLPRNQTSILTDLSSDVDMGAGFHGGTIPWAAPEVLNCCRPSPKADVFAFGCLLFELLTCMDPFQGVPAKAIIHTIRHRQPGVLHPLVVQVQADFPFVPDQYLSLMQRCLEHLPGDRPSISGAITHLQSILRDVEQLSPDDRLRNFTAASAENGQQNATGASQGTFSSADSGSTLSDREKRSTSWSSGGMEVDSVRKQTSTQREVPSVETVFDSSDLQGTLFSVHNTENTSVQHLLAEYPLEVGPGVSSQQTKSRASPTLETTIFQSVPAKSLTPSQTDSCPDEKLVNSLASPVSTTSWKRWAAWGALGAVAVSGAVLWLRRRRRNLRRRGALRAPSSDLEEPDGGESLV